MTLDRRGEQLAAATTHLRAFGPPPKMPSPQRGWLPRKHIAGTVPDMELDPFDTLAASVPSLTEDDWCEALLLLGVANRGGSPLWVPAHVSAWAQACVLIDAAGLVADGDLTDAGWNRLAALCLSAEAARTPQEVLRRNLLRIVLENRRVPLPRSVASA